MSKSRRSNPIAYTLTPVRGDVIRHLTALRKQTTYIFRSFMKRLRAAYNFRVKQLNNSQALREDTKQHELRMWATACADQEEEINAMFTQVMDALTPTKWSVYVGRGVFDTRNFDTIANSKIDDGNKGIKTAEIWVKRIEDRGFKTPRNMQREPSGFTEREHLIYQTRILHRNLKALMLELKANYPYIREKYRARLAKMIFAVVADEEKHGGITRMPITPMQFRASHYTMDVLVKAGIPAADVVGPWWHRTQKIKSPMDYIKVSEDLPDGYYDWRSPIPGAWLNNVGLDGRDPSLVESVKHYYNSHKTAPSVEWARQRSNELDEERMKREIAGQIRPVAEWLAAALMWRKQHLVTIPPLLGEWKVVMEEDARELCQRAKRDGLCVVDVLTALREQAADIIQNHGEPGNEEEDFEAELFRVSNQEGVVTLLFSTDPKRRTVVGLDENGVCTSEHHCTGKDNKLDQEAWEYFREH